MQQTRELNSSSSSVENQRLRDKHVRDLMVEKRRLVEVSYRASLAHTMNALVANRVVAVPVAAPPGHWIGAGGSMIMESDIKQTGAVRKHYIGMVTMLDILAHISGDDQMDGGDVFDLDQKMAVPVSSIIGHCLEGLSLWTLSPNTSMLDCMEVFSKGIHRALVPLDSHMANTSGVELVESASSYRMLTQMDLLRFLKEHESDIEGIISRPLSELGAVTENVYAITDRTKVIEAIKCMRATMLNAVPIVTASNAHEEDHKQLINGRGRKLIGTFSSTDLRGSLLATLQSWLPLSALDFTEYVSKGPLYASSDSPRQLVTCLPESSLTEVIDKAVTKHVHRVWVVDQQGLLVGLVSLTDIIRVIRLSLQSESRMM
ncbi:LOW QUALITY PROTEIN: SNF1-related protein kinase regulatory subunit gamma-like PV42a [Quercus lobata]|uniref:LOW QUALITY PROTEIN: SNF1-related protein kinase regulatory subunit gamma-like PV42a n=1 Tax=Quercus lobata TaxID=97700 RepID=UPI0012454DBE|nr:LOW QUALITY PROTEIN: SNF1-related protein kinase regulatory subunit gamma-like PV42a [Quercus lobata]